MPRHSAVQWSTVMKMQAWPSPVMAPVWSLPHISSGRSVVMRPSWSLPADSLKVREGESRLASRIRRGTRRLQTRVPFSRSWAQTLR